MHIRTCVQASIRRYLLALVMFFIKSAPRVAMLEDHSKFCGANISCWLWLRRVCVNAWMLLIQEHEWLRNAAALITSIHSRQMAPVPVRRLYRSISWRQGRRLPGDSVSDQQETGQTTSRRLYHSLLPPWWCKCSVPACRACSHARDLGRIPCEGRVPV